MEEQKMKYVNPEYVSILAASEDVVTVSVVDVTPPEATNYTQTKETTYGEDGTVQSVTTIISANLNSLGI